MNTYQLKPASKEAMDQQILHVSSERDHPLSISYNSLEGTNATQPSVPWRGGELKLNQ